MRRRKEPPKYPSPEGHRPNDILFPDYRTNRIVIPSTFPLCFVFVIHSPNRPKASGRPTETRGTAPRQPPALAPIGSGELPIKAGYDVGRARLCCHYPSGGYLSIRMLNQTYQTKRHKIVSEISTV